MISDAKTLISYYIAKRTRFQSKCRFIQKIAYSIAYGVEVRRLALGFVDWGMSCLGIGNLFKM